MTNVRGVDVTAANNIPLQRRTRTTVNSFTDVVSHAFCDSSLQAEEKIAKKSLEEVHTFAELKHDPRASLPDLFSICSTIMTPSCRSDIWPTIFTILGNDQTQFLAAIRNHGSVESLFEILYSDGLSGAIIGQTPPLFPNQWTRNCMAVNTTSGLINWVVDGTLVMTTISEKVQRTKSRPRDLSKRLVLGTRSIGGVWFAPSHKVTNVNIFSSALSIERMKRMTGGESCVEEGDCLAWADMEWILHGQARKETVDTEEPCKLGHKNSFSDFSSRLVHTSALVED